MLVSPRRLDAGQARACCATRLLANIAKAALFQALFDSRYEPFAWVIMLNDLHVLIWSPKRQAFGYIHGS